MPPDGVARTDRFAFLGFTAPNDKGVLSLSLPPNYLVSENTGRLAVRRNGETDVELFHFEDAEYAGDYPPDEPPKCSVAGGVLNCAYGNATILQLCPGLEVFTNDWYFGPTVRSGCVEVVLEVVPVCVMPAADA